MLPVVVNLVGGPGAGKSTLAAGVFTELKWKGVNCELVTEYAKDKVWEESYRILEDQIYILGKQHHRLFRLSDKVDVIITDSPLFLSLIYGAHWGDTFAALTVELFNKFNNLTYFVERQKRYNPAGRVQTEEKAKAIDALVKEKLGFYSLPYKEIPGVMDSTHIIVDEVVEALP